MALQNLSIEELEELNRQLTDQRLEIKQQQREISQLLDQKRAEQRLEADIAALQNEHGVTVVVPHGVEAKAN